jgi:hypothetical protein
LAKGRFIPDIRQMTASAIAKLTELGRFRNLLAVFALGIDRHRGGDDVPTAVVMVFPVVKAHVSRPFQPNA